MGRQVNFFDASGSGLSHRRDCGEDCTVVVSERSTSPKPSILDCGKPSSILTLLPKACLVRTTDVNDIQLTSAGHFFYVDTLRSPVVEFSPSRLNENELQRGRLFFDSGYFDRDGTWRPKSDDYVSWARGWLKWIEKNHEYDRTQRAYLGLAAKAAIREGSIQLRSF